MMSTSRIPAIAAAILTITASGCASPARAANVPLPHGCESRYLADALPAGANVQLLVAAGNTIPARTFADYRAMALHVVRCAGGASTLTLRPVNGQSFSEPAFAVEKVPAQSADAVNPIHNRAEANAFKKRETAAIDRLEQYPNPVHWSDPLGALLAAADAQSLAEAGPKRIVLIGNGYLQTPEYNIFRFRENPERFVEPVLRTLREKHTLPALDGTIVIIVGVTSGAPGMDGTTGQVRGVCRFWRAIVTAGHGTLAYCGRSLPDASGATL
jgi:hypothetical protein